MNEPGKLAYEAWAAAMTIKVPPWESGTQAPAWAAVEAACMKAAFEEAAKAAETMTFPDAANPIEEAIIKGAKVCAKNIAAAIRTRATGG